MPCCLVVEGLILDKFLTMKKVKQIAGLFGTNRNVLYKNLGKYFICTSKWQIDQKSKNVSLPGVAQIRFYLVILWKSQEISLLIKVFCLLSDYSKTCTKCRSTIEDLFHKVSLQLVKRWRIFINGEFHKYLLRKIRSSWIWATPGLCIRVQKGMVYNFYPLIGLPIEWKSFR